MTDRSSRIHELHPQGDRPGLRARVAELLLEATDLAETGRVLFDLVAAELKLNVLLLYVAGDYGQLDLVAYGGLSEAEAASAATQDPLGCGISARARLPLTGHIAGVQELKDGSANFLRSIGLKAWFGQALMAGERVLGVIGFGRRWADSFQDEDIPFLQGIAHHFAVTLGRLRSQAALRENEERLRLGMAVAGFHTFDCNLLTGQVVLTPETRAHMGLPPDRPVTLKQIEETIHPDDRERVRAWQQACEDPEGPGELDQEFRFVAPDGAVRWVHVRARAFFAGEGGARHAVRVIGVQQDITERRMAEQRLRTSEERLRLALDAAGMGMFDYDIERDENIWSPRLRAIYGIGPDESVDLERASRQVHPDDRQRIVDAIWGGFKGDFADYSHEYRIFRPDGELRWLAVKAARLFSPGGPEHSPKRLIGVVQDITERKVDADRLHESEERLQLAQELGGVASFEWDRSNDDFWVSESYRRIFGLLPDAQVNRAAWRALVHPDDFEQTVQQVLNAAETGEIQAVEYRIIRPSDRQERWIYSVCGLLRDPFNQAVRLAGVALDITDRKRNEERERLLSREIDHRAKNLLSVVQAMVQLTHAPTIPEFVDKVKGRILALSRVHSLLAASRWGGADLANLIAEELASDVERSRLTGPPVALKPAAAQSMALVIHELATNAVKYGSLSVPGGRVDVAWDIRSAPEGQLVLFWRESGGPRVVTPQHFGFGLTHIRGSVERQLGGAPRLNWRVEGLECELVLPVRQLAQMSA